ncbi:thioredoxin family protein [Compostibacter hankyongensis]|uniref:Thioredoxin family protein n=2 Tax=Compostibacter hankyongensis TaxID=1007089 RepID=A0ABP8FDH3_9BACT
MLVVLLLTAAVQLKAQDKQTVYAASGEKVITGPLTMKALANDSAFGWFYTGVNKYKPDPALIKYISAYRDSFDVVVFAGTWCQETKDLLPKFFSTMLASSYPVARIHMYGVDQKLDMPGDEAKQLHLTKVPTFIVLRKGKEVGRIEERVQKSIEADLVAILDKMMAAEQGTKAVTAHR